MTKFENDALAEPINVKQGTTTVSGTLEKKSNDPDIGVYTLIFTPSEDLALNSTYLVYIDPKLVDDDNNPVFPIQFKFTTKSNMSNKNNPHGNYLILTNGQPSEDHTYLCANCHSTHIGSNPSLEGGIYKNLPSDPNLVTWGSQNGLDYTGINQNLAADPSKNYCMACHDGTMNAPIVDNIDKTYHHSMVVDNSSNKNELKNTDTCTTCHNPHLTWTEDNPNMLKDHYIYTSNKDATKKIDSLDVSCQSCHGDNPVYDINEYTNSEHHVLSYKKSSTADGRLNNYSLCLRCHKTDENKNIEQYYTQTNSGHYFTIPQGKKTNDDGSKLNGPIPCAECHDTHGSNNVKMLRENLGNVQTKDLYTKTIGEFTVSDENQFCLKCHNNSTAIYGRVGKFREKNENGQPITGHQQEDLTTVRCSECHGGDSKTFIEASHAPKPVPTTR
jgi:hypothetical protein